MPQTRTLQTAVLLALLTLTAGCQTTIGNYFGNRARDFGESFLVQAGLGLGLGVDVKAAGLLHLGGMATLVFLDGSVGWLYGEPRPAVDPGHFPLEGDVGLPFAPFRQGMLHQSYLFQRDHRYAHGCYGLLPALLSWTGTQVPIVSAHTWLWSDATRHESDFNGRYARWARVHAFDIEVGATVLIVGARAGFSPGEFLDFLLGWVGIDIAGDDVGGEEVPEPSPGEAEPQREAGK